MFVAIDVNLSDHSFTFRAAGTLAHGRLTTAEARQAARDAATVFDQGEHLVIRSEELDVMLPTERQAADRLLDCIRQRRGVVIDEDLIVR